LLIAVFESAAVIFYYSSSTKVLIGLAVILVLAITSIGLVSIQYLIVNAKTSFLKESKLLRLEHLGLSTDHVDSQAREAALTGTSSRRTLSLWENIAWCFAFLLVASCTAGFTNGYYMQSEVLAPSIETSTTLTPEGAGTEVMKVSYPYFGFVPRSSFQFTTSDESASIRWVDDQGRELPASISALNGQKHYTVHLLEPVKPGDRVRYTQITESPAFAAKKDDIWTCRINRTFGDEKKEAAGPVVQLVVGSTLVDIREPAASFSDTIQLPYGAESSEDPKATWSAVWNGTPASAFRATRNRNQAFTYSIKYRLAKDNTEKKEDK
jgi:hypothetical protein